MHTHTHTETHASDPCTYASTHARMHTCTHTHKVVVAGDTHNLQRTFFSPTILKYSLTGLLKGLDLLELAILFDRDMWTSREGRLRNYTDIRIHAVTFEWCCNDRIFEYCTIRFMLWHSNGAVMIEYSNIVLFVSCKQFVSCSSIQVAFLWAFAVF